MERKLYTLLGFVASLMAGLTYYKYNIPGFIVCGLIVAACCIALNQE